MDITLRPIGNVVVLDLKGKLTLGEGDQLLRAAVTGLIMERKTEILLNLKGVPYIDSSGLQVLVHCHEVTARNGGALKLLNLTKRIMDLLAISKLLPTFKIFDSEPEAIKSFTAEPTTP